MKETLISYAWVMYHSCNCRGVYTEYYSNVDYPGFKILIKPKKNRFIAKQHNLTLKDANNYQLEEYLKTL